MKVLLFNGSPHVHGCTAAALEAVADVLHAQNIETETIQIGSHSFQGCMGCYGCRNMDGCVFGDTDGLNDLLLKCRDADGFVFGSPVYYASCNGTLSSFMDRLFFSGSKYLAHKPAAAVVSARRAGTSAALDQIQKYFLINQMPVVSSTYWNMVHGGGNRPEEAKQDLEGMQTMRNLGKNMAWLLSCIEAGKQAGLSVPEADRGAYTSFIR